MSASKEVKPKGRRASDRLDFEPEFLAWIQENLKKPGKTSSGMGKALGLDKSSASHIANGHRPLRVQWLPKLAAYFETPMPSFANMSGAPQIRYAGHLEAGVYRHYPTEQGEERLGFIPDEAYDHEDQMVFLVLRSGLDAYAPRPIMDGDHVLCVTLDAFGGLNALQDGMLVAVSREIEPEVEERSLRVLTRDGDRLAFSHHSRSKTTATISDGDDGVTLLGVARKLLSNL